MTPLLDVRELKISFQKPVVHGISFTLLKGETLAFVGESGSGKSLTAQAILLPQGKVEGEILFDGENLLHKSKKEMRSIQGAKIGMVFQDPLTSLNPTLTIGTQIQEVLQAHQKISKKEALFKTTDLLHQVGIPDPQKRIHFYPFQLSGGMQQRALIAMAIACSPSLLIADEPTTALDVTIQAQILDLFHKLKTQNGMGLLFITHDLAVAASIADKICVMQNGHIVEAGSAVQVFKNPSHPYTQQLLAKRR